MFICRYIWPYEVLERIGAVVYRLTLSPSLSGVHDVFHISQLRKCISDPDAVIETNQLEVQPNLTMSKRPMRMLDRTEKNAEKEVDTSS